MSKSCEGVRDALLEHPPWDSAVESHVASCSGCALLAEGDRRILEAFVATARHD